MKEEFWCSLVPTSLDQLKEEYGLMYMVRSRKAVHQDLTEGRGVGDVTEKGKYKE